MGVAYFWYVRFLSLLNLLFPFSDSPYSEHGTLEEVDQDASTEPHTSEDGMSVTLLCLWGE